MMQSDAVLTLFIKRLREFMFSLFILRLDGGQIEPNFATLIEAVSWDTATGLRYERQFSQEPIECAAQGG